MRVMVFFDLPVITSDKPKRLQGFSQVSDKDRISDDAGIGVL